MVKLPSPTAATALAALSLGLATTGASSAALAQTAAACEPGAAGCFVLLSLTVDGVSAYPLRDLAPLYADYLARPISQAELVTIAQAITDKYRADGYFLSRAVVPPQGETDGHARLRVYEGYVTEVEVTGASAAAVRPMLAAMAGRRPLKLADLERRLMLAGDITGVRVRTAIEPVLDDPAQHRLVVDASLQRLTGSVSLDNRGTRTVGPDQLFARLGVNSLIRPGDQLSLAALTVPSDPGEIAYGELAYSAAFTNGARLRAAVSGSRSGQGVSLRNEPAGTESRGVGVRLAYPLVRARKHAVWGAVALDARHVEQVYRAGGAYQDELRVVRASVNANHGLGPTASSLYVQASGGLGALGASRSSGFGRSRFDADGQFVKLNAGASHYRDIGRRAGLFLSADAQWSPDPLLLSEEFAPGGQPYGRAYNYAEISGDSGVAGLAELRFGWDPKMRPLTFFQTYAFADAAKVWNTRSALGRRTANFASAGAGVRFTFQNRVNLRVEAAKPLGPSPWETGDRRWRAFASLSASF